MNKVTRIACSSFEQDFSDENQLNSDKNSIHCSSDAFFCAFKDKAKSVYGDANFDRWIAKLSLYSLSESEVVLSAPSKFVRDWVMREFIMARSGQSLIDISRSIQSSIRSVFVVHDARQKIDASVMSDSSKVSQKKDSDKVVSISKHDNVFAFGSDLNPKYKFSNFVSAKYNKMAVSMAKIAASSGFDSAIDSTNPMLPNLFDEKIPLFIHGEVGTGKTHLVQAIAWHIKENDKSKKVLYLSAEKFMHNFVQSVKDDSLMGFKEKMKSIDVLIVDDIHFIAGKQGTQREFMCSFNSLVDQNKQVILACDRRPGELEDIDEKLKSRISAGMVINFKLPDFEDRIKILKAKFNQVNIKPSNEVLEFLAKSIKTSIRDLEGAVKKLVTANIILGEEITVDAVSNIIADYVSKTKITPTIDRIQSVVSEHYGISVSDLKSDSRARSISFPRQVAMFFSKSLTKDSLSRIALRFSKKNHATVLHASKSITKLMESDSALKREIGQLEKKILKN